MPRSIIGTFQNVHDRCSLLFSYPPVMPMSSPHDGKVMGAKKQFDPFQFPSADPHIGLSSEQTRSSEKTRRLGFRLAAFIGYGGFLYARFSRIRFDTSYVLPYKNLPLYVHLYISIEICYNIRVKILTCPIGVCRLRRK